jgi:hypothetical protein
LSTFVIASNECDAIRIPYLECQEQQKGFHTVIAAVHKVAEKQVILVGTLSAHLEQFDQVVKLAMNVPTNLRERTNENGIYMQ